MASKSWLRALISKIIRVDSEEMVNRRALRLIAGEGITLTPQDSAFSDETRVTISRTGGEGGISLPIDATDVNYDPASSWLPASNVQEAIDALAGPQYWTFFDAPIANGANANIDIPLPEGLSGYYLLTVTVLAQRAATQDTRRISFVVDVVSIDEVAELSGPPEILGGGNKAGLTLAVSVTGNSVRTNVANTTGEDIGGQLYAWWRTL